MSLARQPATIKELSQEAFRKFKCVRKLSSKLMGSYSLYSMHSQKYIGKELPHGAIFKTTRKDQTISKV